MPRVKRSWDSNPDGVASKHLSSTTPDSRGGLKKSRDWACVLVRREELPAPGGHRMPAVGGWGEERKVHLENGPRSLTLEKAENSQEPAGILVHVRPSGLSCQLGCSWRSQPSPALSPLWPWTSLWGLQPPCPSFSLSYLIYASPTHRSPGMFGARAGAQVTSLLLSPAPQNESGWEWIRLGHTASPKPSMFPRVPQQLRSQTGNFF